MTNATETRTLTPRVNIFETDDVFTIEAELPGVRKDDAEIELNDGRLTVRGKRQSKPDAENPKLRERAIGDFRRTFTIGDAIVLEKVHAEMSDGVLTVTLPKVERLKARTVSIN